MLYSGLITLPRSIVRSAGIVRRWDNLDVIPLGLKNIKISLSTFFLIVALVALSVSNYVSLTQLSRAKGQLDKFRRELGVPIDDPTLVHILPSSTPRDLTWKWKIYLPEGRFKLNYGTEYWMPPANWHEAMRGSHTKSINGPIDFTVTATANRNDHEKWQIRIETSDFEGGVHVLSGLNQKVEDWLEGRIEATASCPYSPSANSYQIENPADTNRIIFYDALIAEPGQTTVDELTEFPAYGLYFWLEPDQ